MTRSPSVFLLALAVYASAQPQSRDKEAILTRMEINALSRWHYSPPPPDDAFSEHVFDLFLKRLDTQKRFLLQEDIDLLSTQRDSLDDQLANGSYAFCEAADAVLAKRIAEVRALTGEFLKGPLRLDEEDSLVADADKQPYCKTKAEREQRWARVLKYQILNRIEDKLEEKVGKDKDTTLRQKPLPPPDSALIADAVAYVARNLDRGFARMIREKKLDRVAIYLNTVANVFDPHTEYFKPQAREEFNLSMTGKLEGIGAVLREEDGYIKVVSIVPGSASWRQKELKAEDKILKVGQGSEEPVDVVDASVDEAVRLIRGKKGTEVRLTVMKPNGQVRIIPIIRDVVVIDETYAKSAVLKPPGSKGGIGYISLPLFYRDFNNPNARNSSGDVKNELKKLEAKKVDGIILDLRGNGGGALEDAVDMGGLFIPDGPIVQVKNRNGSIELKQDYDESVTWDGPLVILVNSFSASASEILSAAMQDYGRAVLMGTDTTYGKGTVQIIRDFDELAGSENADLMPMGAIKFTVQKFYRVSGGSTQLRGVTPDILLPDAYTELDVGEKSMEYAMPWDVVKPLNVHRYDRLPLKELEDKSHARVAASPYFRQMGGYVKLQAARRKRPLSVSLRGYFADRERNKHEADTLDALQKKSTDLIVEPLPPDNALAASDSVEQEKAKNWKESLGRDFYLREAVNIVGDWSGKK